MESSGRSLERNREQKREREGRGRERQGLVLLLLDISRPQRGHLLDLRASSPLSGFLDGLHSSQPFCTLPNRWGFVVTCGNLCYLHIVMSASMVGQVLGSPASVPLPVLLHSTRKLVSQPHLAICHASNMSHVATTLGMRCLLSSINQNSP